MEAKLGGGGGDVRESKLGFPSQLQTGTRDLPGMFAQQPLNGAITCARSAIDEGNL